VFVVPLTIEVNVRDCVTITLKLEGLTETVTTLDELPPPPQPASVAAHTTNAPRRVLNFPNFMLTASPTTAHKATAPRAFKVLLNEAFGFAWKIGRTLPSAAKTSG